MTLAAYGLNMFSFHIFRQTDEAYSEHCFGNETYVFFKHSVFNQLRY